MNGAPHHIRFSPSRLRPGSGRGAVFFTGEVIGTYKPSYVLNSNFHRCFSLGARGFFTERAVQTCSVDHVLRRLWVRRCRLFRDTPVAAVFEGAATLARSVPGVGSGEGAVRTTNAAPHRSGGGASFFTGEVAETYKCGNVFNRDFHRCFGLRRCRLFGALGLDGDASVVFAGAAALARSGVLEQSRAWLVPEWGSL
jgi:hypothetical protein